MPQGSAWVPGNATALYRLLYKINSEHRGFNLKFNMAETSEANAMIAADKIGKRLIQALPPVAEIFYATISRWDSKKDARLVPGAIGVGAFAPGGGAPVPEIFDNARSALHVRLEPSIEGVVAYKFPCLPDDVVADGFLVAPIVPVTGTPVASPAANIPGDAWVTIMNNLLKDICFFTHYVKSGYSPGGVYTYDTWKNAYPMKIGVKKGGRVFI